MPRMRFPIAMIEEVKARVSLQEKIALRDAAYKRGLSVSDFLREAALREAKAA